MNILKIMNQILKLNEKEQSEHSVGYQEIDGMVYISLNWTNVFLISAEKFAIDMTKVKHKACDLKQFFNEIGAASAEITSDLKFIQKRKITAVKIAAQHTHVWVDTKLLSMYSKDCTYKITKETSPVYVYKDDVLEGLLMPTRVEEGE